MRGQLTDGRDLYRLLRALGLEAPVIDGIGYVAARYNGQLNDDDLVKKFQNLRGGVAGLLNKAELTHRQTGKPKTQCVAATVVEVANRGRRGTSRLNDWWAS